MEDLKSATDFWVIGINYRKADTTLRGAYAVNEHQYEAILDSAKVFGVSSLFVLSTCNRTELYGFAEQADQLTGLLCRHTEGSAEAFTAQAYIKKGNEALNHIFNVAAGLDSQILGDYEIVGQIKQAFYFARDRGYTNSFLDRLFNTVLQSCRAIRSETKLSSGTVSVAFAAVQFIRNRIDSFDHKRILILGSGEIGQAACRNLLTFAGKDQVTLINRTEGKAQALAEELGLHTAPFEMLRQYIRECDIIIVATAAATPLITVADLAEGDEKILIDLSIPNNIDAAVQQYKGIVLANVDDLSRINDETLRKRQAEIPKAEELITCHIHEFAEWYLMQQHVPVLKAVKEKLHALNMQLAEARQQDDKQAVQKALNTMAKKMRTEEQRPGCNYIETIHHYLKQTVA
ncbi:glutamyl-tRNA reductase [Taibaiella koreensis]|uniref:glutamyl-tRNA reductase n=1 Tax=Taibaiella koreensis TaxID=1268548 RepID=UPI001F089FD8|nr:glutamyl-tRNA reductase [Taibaiella koreensis]